MIFFTEAEIKLISAAAAKMGCTAEEFIQIFSPKEKISGYAL